MLGFRTQLAEKYSEQLVRITLNIVSKYIFSKTKNPKQRGDKDLASHLTQSPGLSRAS